MNVEPRPPPDGASEDLSLRTQLEDAANGNELEGDDLTQLPQKRPRTIEDLINPPKDLARIRQWLFEIKDKIELQVDEFEKFWPYVDNVWVRQHKAGADKSGRVVTDYYACRLQRPTYTPKPSSTPRKEGQPTRKKQIREGGTCQMRLKTVRYDGGYSGYTIVRIGDEMEHTHSLDHIDAIKRTSVMMEIARSEVMKGYMPASVFTVMNEDLGKLAASGGKFLSRNDVRNASQQWRQEHKEELLVHPGYKYDHGNGIVREESGNPPSTGNGFNGPLDPALTRGSGAPAESGLYYPEALRGFLEPYLASAERPLGPSGLPHVTVTYASSLDSCISLAPGLQTYLSGSESKAMTHYLRSKHDAILVGVGTAIADNPGLNCRLQGAGGYGGIGWQGQPRPVIIDPTARWLISPQSRILETVRLGKGRAPWVVMAPGFRMDPMRLDLLNHYGGKYLGMNEFDKKWRLRWEAIFKALAAEGIRSVMIEGGAMVINGLLQAENAHLVDSVIVTLTPTYLGRGGVTVSPPAGHDAIGRPLPALPRFEHVKWQPMGDSDVVFCGKVPRAHETAPPVPEAQMSVS